MPANSSFSSAPPPFHTKGPILLRPPSTIIPSPLPQPYNFLSKPTAHRKYRINFRHPAYDYDDNLLFSLWGWDHENGGIHHGLAHNACAIFADNRFDGWLSTGCKEGEGEKVTVGWDEVLPADVKDYYFFVPDNNEHENSPTPPTPPYRWPIVTNFQDWKFPHVLPPTWKRCEDTQGADSTTAAQSTLLQSVQVRDIVCRITAFQTATEAAHIIPEHESQWFVGNSMGNFNINSTLDSVNMLRDPSNALLLRTDVHTAFDERQLVFFPKFQNEDQDSNFVVHMLQPTIDLGQLYHNTPVKIPHCGLEFLFARFAWSIFPLLSTFLSRPVKNRLVVNVHPDGVRIIDVMNQIKLDKKVLASRSNSPTKRSRIASQLDDDVEDWEVDSEEEDVELKKSKRRRISADHINSIDSSPLSYIQSHSTIQDQNDSELDIPLDDLPLGNPIIVKSSPIGSTILDPKDEESKNEEEKRIRSLRAEALARQRPSGYPKSGMPKYWRHRPAREELEIIGVEILNDEDSKEVEE